MRKYEVVIIFAPTLTDDEVEQSTEDFKKAAEEKGAQISALDQWGKRKLAYPIEKHAEGIYVILTIEEPAADAVGELERRFRVSESVIRFLTVRIDLDLKRAEKFKVRRDKKKRKTAPSDRTDGKETATV